MDKDKVQAFIDEYKKLSKKHGFDFYAILETGESFIKANLRLGPLRSQDLINNYGDSTPSTPTS